MRFLLALLVVLATGPALAQSGRLSPQGGTVVKVAASPGSGIVVTGTTAKPLIGVDTTAIQSRVTGTCSAGSSIRVIASDGSVTCEVDDIGTAGAGLTLLSGVFAIDPDYTQRRVTGTCSAGSSIREIAEDGTVTCETDDAGITNSAGANVIPKSDGPNLVASSWTDDGTNTTTTANIIGTNAVFGSATTTTAKVYSVVTGSGTGLRADNTSSGKTSDSYGVRSVQTGSFDSTAATRRNYGVSAQAAASRSAGSNDVINFGVYATASGGQVNYSLYGDAGTVALNVSSGNTCIGATSCSSKLSVAGTTSISGNTTIGGTLAISTASGTAPTMTWTQSGFTSWTIYQPPSNHGLRIENSSNGATLTLSTTGVAVSRDLAVSGDTTLGNAGTDTITVVGLSTFNAAADFDSTVNVDGDLTANANTTIGDADSDYLNARGTLAVSGTDVSINSCGSNASVSGEAQSFQVTVGEGSATCTVDLNRTFNSAPYCTFSAANQTAAGHIAASTGPGAAPRISSTTTTVTLTFDAALGAGGGAAPIYNVFCLDRR